MTAAPSAQIRAPGRGGATPCSVGLFGLLGQGNLGNDGSMEAVLAHLRNRHPDLVLDVLCSEPDVLTARYGLPAARLQWHGPDREPAPGRRALTRRAVAIAVGVAIDAVHTAAWVRRHDAVVVPGMGVLETTVPMRPWRTPYSMFLLCASGRLFRTRVALISVGANVTNRRLTRWLITAAVRLAHYRSYRDDVSRDAMRSMGVDTSADVVYPDVAFAIPVSRDVQLVPGSVGLGVMDYSGSNEEIARAGQLRDNYQEQVTSFGRWLIDHGRRVRLFTSDTADEPVMRDIAANIRAHRPDLDASWVVAEPALTINELMRQIATVEVVVATRYHNVLYALLQDKPTLALAYASKHELLMTNAGLAGFSLPCRTLDASDLVLKFQELEQRSPELRLSIAEHNAAKKRKVDSQFAEISALLFAPTSATTNSRRPR
jgi:polysaccharide pyruvyl transferase WcaK-like protein